MAKARTNGEYLYHVACISPKCSSSDGMSIWKHSDGRHNAYCHVCGHKIYRVDPETLEGIEYKVKEEEEYEEVEDNTNLEDVQTILEELPSDSLKARKIKKEIVELYGVKVVYNDKGEQTGHYYPTHRDDQVVGYSKRDTWEGWEKQCKKKPELVGKMKKFSTVGYAKVDVQLFGQSAFPAPAKSKGEFKSRVYVTTGQEDALAGAAMVAHKGKKLVNYPFVSVVGGDDGGIQNLKANLKYLSAYDEIYICADNDKSGKKFQDAACKILPVGKVNLVSFKEKFGKDLSDLWNKDSPAERDHGVDIFWSAIWNPQTYSPAGIKSLSQGWDDYLHRGEDPLIPFPDSFGNLNERTHGGYGADGEIVNVAAPSSVGKSSFIKEMVYKALLSTDRNIGVISLEETLSEFLEGLLSVHMSTQLNEIPFDQRDREAERKSFDELLRLNGNDEARERVHFLEDPGACQDEDELWEKVDFLITGLDCTMIVLDPVTLALSLGIDEDEYNATLVKKVKRHKLAWINVHHVRKSSGGTVANSEGADLAEEDIKGSGSHFQTGMINIILTRNKVHEHEIVRNTTKIKLSKCRRHGKNTGIAGFTYYDGKTGRLVRGVDPQDIINEAEQLDNETSQWE